MNRKMVAVSIEIWRRLKRLQVEETDGGTVPTMSRLVERGLEAMEVLADIVNVINSEDGPPFQEPQFTPEELEWLERAEAVLGKVTS